MKEDSCCVVVKSDWLIKSRLINIGVNHNSAFSTFAKTCFPLLFTVCRKASDMLVNELD